MLKGLVINCRLVITLVMLSLLAACETTVLAPDGQTMLQQFDRASHESQYEQRLALEKNWLIEGKFSFSSPDQSGQGSYKWNRAEENGQPTSLVDELRLFGPFGAGAVTMQVSAKGATITSGRQTKSAESIEQLSLSELGWLLPYSDLQYWLFGLPDESKPAWVAYDEKQKLQLMSQSGWSISFSGEKKINVKNEVVYLPKKITAHHTITKTKVKLIVSKANFRRD